MTPSVTQNIPKWRTEASKLYVVLPAYNEEANIDALLQRIDATLFEDKFDYQIILVDDGSSDRTAEIARHYATQLPLTLVQHQQNQGLGATIRDGLKTAAEACNANDIIVAMDADNTHSPGLIRRMVRQVREGSDVVIASRFRRGAQVHGVPWHRALLSIAASWTFRICFPTRGVRDFTCGFRAYRGEVLVEAFRQFGDQFINRDGFEAMVDILLKLRRMKLVFSEVPLILRYDLKANLSKMDVAATIRKTLNLIWRRRMGGKTQ